MEALAQVDLVCGADGHGVAGVELGLVPVPLGEGRQFLGKMFWAGFGVDQAEGRGQGRRSGPGRRAGSRRSSPLVSTFGAWAETLIPISAMASATAGLAFWRERSPLIETLAKRWPSISRAQRG